MSLTSASTDAEVRAAYDDNASYFADGSAAKCKDFLTAALILLRRMQIKAQDGGTSFESAPLQKEIDEAKKFLREAGGLSDLEAVAGRTTVADVSGFRDY